MKWGLGIGLGALTLGLVGAYLIGANGMLAWARGSTWGAARAGYYNGWSMMGPAPYATGTVTSASGMRLGDTVPTDASVDRRTRTITFHTQAVHLTVVMSPMNEPDLTFRIAGLVNPAVVVPSGAKVVVTVVNADADMWHNWALTPAQPPFPYMAMMASGMMFGGIASVPLPPATSTKMPVNSVSFTAPGVGTYTYLCDTPGHAEKGMYGVFKVT
jgi:rusticyanin